MNSKPGEHFYADRTILGARLKWWRTEQQQTIQNVATTLGVSTATWGHWETGHTFPSGDMLLNLSRMTELPLQLLFCPFMENCPFDLTKRPSPAGSPCSDCDKEPSPYLKTDPRS